MRLELSRVRHVGMSSSRWLSSSTFHHPLRLLAIIATVGSTLYLLHVFVLPNLSRFRFRSDLSWYDLGFYGFGPSRSYVSFEYESPLVEITRYNDSACDPDPDTPYTFLAPRGDSVVHPGPVILDAAGELVWKKRNWRTTQDFRVQRFRGEDYLTYWEGGEADGVGSGVWYMLDSTYTPRYVIAPVGPFDGGDMHEFYITPEGTALITIYDPTPADLRSVGGPEMGWIHDCVFQEIDLANGELIFEWRASEHFPVNSTYHRLAKGGGEDRDSGFDFFHINSVELDDRRNYIISARHTHTVSCIDRKTGEIVWTLGGKTNEFTDLSNGEATSFSWQHDARWHAETNTLTLFDNAAHSYEDSDRESRGMAITLDIPNRRATLQAAYYHPHHTKSVSQGNMQLLGNGSRVLVGWGHSAAYSEFSADGKLLCNVHFGASAFFEFGRVVSYRALKGSWVGNPRTPPDAEVVGETIYVSWNGATEVVSWQLQHCSLGDNSLGDDANKLECEAVDEFEKSGFETQIPLPDDSDSQGTIFRLAALDAHGSVIGVTDPLQRDRAKSTSGGILGLHYWIVGVACVMSACGLIAGLYRIWGYCRCRRLLWHRSEYRLLPIDSDEERSA